MKHTIVKRFIWIVIFAVLLYTAFFIYNDFQAKVETMRRFPWRTLPIILGSVLINFLVRELKWDFFRRAARVNVPRGGSFLIYFSGYSMSISPGRVGELIKPFMYKEYFNQKMRRTIPLVLSERVSDLLGMVLVGALTASAFAAGVERGQQQGAFSVMAVNAFLVLSVIFMIILVWTARQKRLVYRVLIGLGQKPRLRQPMHKLRKMYFETYPLLTAKNLTVGTLLAAFSWSFECIALWMVLHGTGATGVTLMQSAFLFCMATIFGGFLFFLPGGLGGFDTSLIGMLALLGVQKSLSVPAVFIIRCSTLFFSVILGFLFILITSWRYHKGMMWEEFEHTEERQN